jgi:hypothetical protein
MVFALFLREDDAGQSAFAGLYGPYDDEQAARHNLCDDADSAIFVTPHPPLGYND